jgi:hypothetical protein
MWRSAGLAWVVVLPLGACVQVLGNDFTIRQGSGGGGSTTSSGTGGDAGGAPLGGGGQGGVGGTVGAGCDPYDFGACGSNKKCSVVNFTTGDTDCIDTISQAAWSACDDDGDCIEGTFCSPLYGTCKRLCQNATDCTDGDNSAVCNVAWLEVGGAEIPGVQLCSAGCNAATSLPCVTPGATCNFTSVAPSVSGFDCVEAGPVPLGGTCEGETAQDLRPDCVAGHGCFGNPQTQMGECMRYCSPIGQQAGCPANQMCNNASVGTMFGTCG